MVRHRFSTWLAAVRAAFAMEPVGAALLLAAAAWSPLTAMRAGADARPVLLFFAMCAVGYIVGRVLTWRHRLLVPSLVACIGIALIVAAGPDAIFTRAPRAGPFGYSSATGAFFAQCALAAIAVATAGSTVALRAIAAAVAIVFGTATLATGTRAAAVALFGLAPLIWLVKARLGTRRAISACEAAFVAGLVISLGLAATYAPGERDGPVDRLVDATLSERRVMLHHDALALMLEHPLAGVGAGRFNQAASSPAARDPDAPWAHHEFLQAGAEAGVLGFVLLGLLFLWAFEMLRRRVASRAVSLLAALALCALGLNAMVEHLFQWPAIPAVTAALVGAAVGRRGDGGGAPEDSGDRAVQ